MIEETRVIMHRWYAEVYHGDNRMGIIAHTPDGLVYCETEEEYEAVTGG